MQKTTWFLTCLVGLPVVLAGSACQGDTCESQEVPTDSSLMQTSHLGKLSSVKADAPQPALTPEEAIAKKRAREPLILETDLEQAVKQLVGRGVLPKAPRFDVSKDECHSHAEEVFKKLVVETGLIGELTRKEYHAFKTRFAVAMVQKHKSIKSDQDWSVASAVALEAEKPLMTAAIVRSLNGAGLGFKARMWKWLLHETKSSSDRRLGFKPKSEGRKSVLRRHASARQAVQEEKLPSSFRAEEKWPMCRDAILRIHNQGHCGSCWAFSGLAPIDARMCIVSKGTWIKPEHTLSRLQALACAPFSYPEFENVTYFDGCMGGDPSWVMDMMADRGVVSTSCLPYYITGEGVEHFRQAERGPACVSHCQQTYNLPLEEDAYISPGVGDYDLLLSVHGDAEKVANMKIAMYTEGPVSFAFEVVNAFFPYAGGVWSDCDGWERANHAVYAFGWGLYTDSDRQVEFIEALNSWGTGWGVNGTFRIHPICLCEVVIPGPMESSIVGHEVLETNDFWPFEKPNECPVDADGCVTDMELGENYVSSELCYSKRLNGKKIRIAEFILEPGYDYVTINGQHFTGWNGTGLDVDALTNLIVDEEGLKFASDSSVEFPGFKLCPVEPGDIDNGTDANDSDVNESDVDPPCATPSKVTPHHG